MRDASNLIASVKRPASLVLSLALSMTALICCWLLPPLVAYEPQRTTALALAALGTARAVLPIRPHARNGLHRLADYMMRHLSPRLAPRRNGAAKRARIGLDASMRAAGDAILWGVIAWCVFSQPIPLTASRETVWAERALPLVLGLAAWLWCELPREWQRRGVIGLALPSLLGLGLLAWPAPVRVVDFEPYYLAVDGHGTLYATDAHASVIRVFASDGSLVAKLRPGLASRAGPPGTGFSPPGPYNDPDRLGVARSTPGANGISAPLQPWPVGADDFWFCGMAVGSGDRLFVPDWMRARLLRFAPDGRLEASWALPMGYQPSLGCVAAAGDELYLADTRGGVMQLGGGDGHLIRTWSVGAPILGGISASSDGSALYALARTRVYRLDPRSGAMSSWPLPAPSGALGQPYQAILALADGRVLVTNLATRRVDVYTERGTALGALGRHGAMPGEFGQVGGLACDAAGRLYVADGDSRVVQRFTSAGHINALYWSPDDDEIE